MLRRTIGSMQTKTETHITHGFPFLFDHKIDHFHAEQ